MKSGKPIRSYFALEPFSQRPLSIMSLPLTPGSLPDGHAATTAHRRKALRVGSATVLVVAVVGLISMRGNWHHENDDSPTDSGDVLVSSAVSQGREHASEIAPPDESIFSAANPDPEVLTWPPEMTRENFIEQLKLKQHFPNKAQVDGVANIFYAPNVTCGFMKSPLSAIDDEGQFPVVEVYVCRRLAPQQPAEPLFVHCGGPGSMSVCIRNTANLELFKQFNVFSIDQRGLGRSKPSFVTQDCVGLDAVHEGSNETKLR